MVKMTALYRQPADVEGFMDHYYNVHLPIIRRLPGLLRMELGKVFTFTGDTPVQFLQADMYFADRDSLLAALKSEPGRESGRDAQRFAGEYVQVYFSDVEVEDFA
ncbi:MAG: EthD family reductase [Alicyclobacillus sp.]|nr:EthD family reductase [Alicyclobacillus sp.]